MTKKQNNKIDDDVWERCLESTEYVVLFLVIMGIILASVVALYFLGLLLGNLINGLGA